MPCAYGGAGGLGGWPGAGGGDGGKKELECSVHTPIALMMGVGGSGGGL